MKVLQIPYQGWVHIGVEKTENVNREEDRQEREVPSGCPSEGGLVGWPASKWEQWKVFPTNPEGPRCFMIDEWALLPLWEHLWVLSGIRTQFIQEEENLHIKLKGKSFIIYILF